MIMIIGTVRRQKSARKQTIILFPTRAIIIISEASGMSFALIYAKLQTRQSSPVAVMQRDAINACRKDLARVQTFNVHVTLKCNIASMKLALKLLYTQRPHH